MKGRLKPVIGAFELLPIAIPALLVGERPMP